MRSVIRASLRTHTRRYVAALLAVGIAVAFVVVTDALASSARAGLTAETGKPYADADLVVTGETLDTWVDVEATDAVLAEVAATGGSAAPDGGTWTSLSHSDGRSISDLAGVGTFSTDPDLAWQTLTEGRSPSAGDEAVMDVERARANEVSLGDSVTVGDGEGALTVRVVGLAETSASIPAALWLPWEAIRGLDGTFVDSISVRTDDPGATTRAIESITLTDDGASTTLSVHTPAAVAEDRLERANQDVDILAMLLLLFGAIAAVVSVMVIANTFSILFAQRQRDFALLRCVGATRRQVRRSVRIEALVLGVVASTFGLALGAGLGYGVVALLRTNESLPFGTMTPSATWWIAAFVGGTLTTLLAAWVPTRTATRISPLAALRPDTTSIRSESGRVRLALAAATLVAGAAGLALAVMSENVMIMLLGGTVFFGGVVLAGPFLIPALLRLVGSVAGRSGPAARLAGANAVRNPRRTAATTASLLVGVTLTTAVLTGMATARSATTAQMDEQYPIDAGITATSEPLTGGTSGGAAGGGQLVDDVASLPGVADAVAVDGLLLEVGAHPTVVLAGDATAMDAVLRDDALQVGDDEVIVSGDALADDSATSITIGERTLRIARHTDTYGPALIVSPATLAQLSGASGEEPATYAVWVRVGGDADLDGLRADLEALVASTGADVQFGAQQRAWVDLQLDIVVWTVVGLLGIGVLIALVGIGNTLGLSVMERARENALLRALGLTRGQLRRTLAAEGLLLSVVATLVGTAVGVLFAVIGVHTMIAPALGDIALVLPWAQLTGVVGVAALAGLLACVLPARRAARIAPAAGLAAE